jgi:integrase
VAAGRLHPIPPIGGPARAPLRFAAREEWFPGDLGATIEVPTQPERLPQPLEAGDRDQLVEALTHDTLAQKRNRALILLLSTGARSSEVFRVDRSEWNRECLWVLGEGDRERIVEVTDKARAGCRGLPRHPCRPLPRPVRWLAAGEQGRGAGGDHRPQAGDDPVNILGGHHPAVVAIGGGSATRPGRHAAFITHPQSQPPAWFHRRKNSSAIR